METRVGASSSIDVCDSVNSGEPSWVPSLDELLTSDPDAFVAKFTDIAAVNLACARGLPNCDEREFPNYMKLLDAMAETVRARTGKSWRLFKLKPQEFHNSENVFRVFTMEHVLRMQFGVKYDPHVAEVTDHGRNQESWRTSDSTEVFIHGVLSEKRTGTCSSLPTFSIAIGRRLGYPLKLIRVPNHTLFRWDDGQEKFNHQHTEAGGEIWPDERFYDWPRKWDEAEYQMNARTKVWLHSMTPRQEVSKFLCNRAIALRELARHEEAFRTLEAAERFDDMNPAVADIWHSIEYATAGGDVRALAAGRGRRYTDEGFYLSPAQPIGPMILSLPGNRGEVGLSNWSVGIVMSALMMPPAPSAPKQTEPDAPDAHLRAREEFAFAEEHMPLVRLINESNRSRSPRHPNGNPPVGPLQRQLNDLLRNREKRRQGRSVNNDRAGS